MDALAQKLQAVLDAQIGRGNVNNVVASVQSHDRRIEFTGAAGIAFFLKMKLTRTVF